jgi:hypothetical protein
MRILEKLTLEGLMVPGDQVTGPSRCAEGVKLTIGGVVSGGAKKLVQAFAAGPWMMPFAI